MSDQLALTDLSTVNLPGLPSKVPPSSFDCVVFDFDGVFTNNFVWINQNGEESVRCWRGDGLGLEKLAALKFPRFVLSSEVNPIVKFRCDKLKIPCRHGLRDKGAALEELAFEHGFDLGKVVYVGNDLNDKPCLERAGWPILVRDAHPAVLDCGLYQTSSVGGFGAVREVCDWLVSHLKVSL